MIQGVVIAALVILMIGRQFVPQRVNGNRAWIFPAALTVFGLYLIGQHPPTGALDIVLLGVNLTVGIVLGFGRGYSMRYWRDAAGSWMRQGTILTFGLWVLMFGLRFGLDFVVHGSFTPQAQAELPLFIGATFGAQAIATWLRMQHVGSRDAFLETVG
jgi:hypothetical protein